MDRLQQLIFSFYREDPLMEELLEPLRDCRMRRSWGSIRIECVDAAHLEQMSGLLVHLRLPLARPWGWDVRSCCGCPDRCSAAIRCMSSSTAISWLEVAN